MGTPSRKVQRLRRSGEFRRVRESGASLTGHWIVLGIWRTPNPDPGSGVADSGMDEAPRFGVVTSRRVGNAVVRNRVRRRLREIHQRYHREVAPGVWCVVVARFRAAAARFADLDKEWCRLARRAGILKPCER
jgi:ribonuclease P protein component